jgi:hypothetical protein
MSKAEFDPVQLAELDLLNGPAQFLAERTQFDRGDGCAGVRWKVTSADPIISNKVDRAPKPNSASTGTNHFGLPRLKLPVRVIQAARARHAL